MDERKRHQVMTSFRRFLRRKNLFLTDKQVPHGQSHSE